MANFLYALRFETAMLKFVQKKFIVFKENQAMQLEPIHVHITWEMFCKFFVLSNVEIPSQFFVLVFKGKCNLNPYTFISFGICLACLCPMDF